MANLSNQMFLKGELVIVRTYIVAKNSPFADPAWAVAAVFSCWPLVFRAMDMSIRTVVDAIERLRTEIKKRLREAELPMLVMAWFMAELPLTTLPMPRPNLSDTALKNYVVDELGLRLPVEKHVSSKEYLVSAANAMNFEQLVDTPKVLVSRQHSRTFGSDGHNSSILRTRIISR